MLTDNFLCINLLRPYLRGKKSTVVVDRCIVLALRKLNNDKKPGLFLLLIAFCKVIIAESGSRLTACA